MWSLSWNEEEIPENLKEQKELISFMKNDLRNKNNNFYCEIYDNIFLHYRSGCNWVGEGLNFHKTHSLNLKNVLLKD